MRAVLRVLGAVHRRASSASPTPGSGAGRGRGPSSRGRRRPAADTSSRRSGGRRSRRGSARAPAAEPAPGVAPALREGQRHEPELDVEPVERTRDRLAPARARRRERDDLVLARARLDEPGERAADVVADARPRMRERADVEHDPHGWVFEASEARRRARAGRPARDGRRRDVEPTVQTSPPAAAARAGSPSRTSGTCARRVRPSPPPARARTVCGSKNELGSLAERDRSVPPRQRTRR